MKPPRRWVWWFVAQNDLIARQSGLEPGDFLDYALGRKPTPPHLIEAFRKVYFPLGEPSLLPSPGKDDTTDTMNASSVSRESARRSRSMMSEAAKREELPKACARLGITITEVAVDIGFPRTSVQAWYKKKGDPGRRTCPPEARRKLARKPYLIPEDSWD